MFDSIRKETGWRAILCWIQWKKKHSTAWNCTLDSDWVQINLNRNTWSGIEKFCPNMRIADVHNDSSHHLVGRVRSKSSRFCGAVSSGVQAYPKRPRRRPRGRAGRWRCSVGTPWRCESDWTARPSTRRRDSLRQRLGFSYICCLWPGLRGASAIEKKTLVFLFPLYIFCQEQKPLSCSFSGSQWRFHSIFKMNSSRLGWSQLSIIRLPS